MTHSSRTKSSISIDLFNLPPLPDARKQSAMFGKIPNNFFIPIGKNSRLSQIINTWTFGRLTPDCNEGMGLEISYLEYTYNVKYYVVDQINSKISAIHDNNIELTEFMGRFSLFDLDELELKVCRITDHQDDDDVFAVPQQSRRNLVALQAQQSDANSDLQSIEDLTGMGFCSPNYSPIPPVDNNKQQQ